MGSGKDRNMLCSCGSGKKYKKCHEERDREKVRTARNILQAQPLNKLFVVGPYKPCPQCGGSRLGVSFLGTGGHSYGRECKDCPYTEAVKLPAIRKRVIYLDQFFISNIAKVLDENSRGHVLTAREPFWLEAFKRLDRLVQMNLVICPDSFFHNEESLLSGDPTHKTLRAVYERLSHGNTFYDHNTITRFQIDVHLQNYISGESEKPLDFDADKMMTAPGKLHDWHGKMRIAVNLNPYPGQIDAIRRERENLYEAIKPVFDRWQTETGRDFMEWVREEAMAFGKGTVLAYAKYLQKRAELPQKYAEQILAGIEPDVSLDDILPPPAADIMEQIEYVLRRNRFSGEERFKIAVEYLRSASLMDLPSNHISSLLYAGIARKAAHGQRAYPDKSTFTDVNAISSLLPYCDAIFIDNAMAALLREYPIDTEMNRYGTEVFSMNSKHAFLEYLDAIEMAATPEHLAIVSDYYGECTPDLEFLKHLDG